MFGPAVGYLRFRALGAPFGGLESWNQGMPVVLEPADDGSKSMSGSMLLALTGICRGLGDAR